MRTQCPFCGNRVETLPEHLEDCQEAPRDDPRTD